VMAEDEEVKAVARAIAAHSGPVNNIDVARSAIAALDRIRSRLVSGTEEKDNDDPTPQVTPEQVKRANEMGRGGGVMSRRRGRNDAQD
jgi:hypothetical protein